MSEKLGPLPAPADSDWSTGERIRFYTADQMRAYAAQEVAKERERCAKICEPKNPRPCDCERCDCGNATDARMVAEWDEAAALVRRIRGS